MALNTRLVALVLFSLLSVNTWSESWLQCNTISGGNSSTRRSFFRIGRWGYARL